VKLLYVSSEKRWHGGEEQLRLLISGAAQAGHECRVAARQGSLVAERIGAAGATVLTLPRSVRGLRSIWRLRREIRCYRPDVIHANDPHALSLQRTSTWGMRVPARVCSRRVLFPIVGTRKYRAGCGRMICVSQAVASLCERSGIPATMLTVVHDGVEPNRVQSGHAASGRNVLGLSDDVPLVLCVAQLTMYKGHRHLLEAMPAILAANPRAVLALAGDGVLRDDLEKLSQSLGVAAAVRFLGHRNDVPDLLQACDLFVMPSQREGLGSSVLDAMFARRAIVGADAGGIPEMLRNAAGEECGWLVNTRDPAALARGIIEALASPAERARRVELAAQWAESEFVASTMVRRTLDVYSGMLACT
jgi:glycosyltransferase involved in cell wall biosynthesis